MSDRLDGRARELLDAYKVGKRLDADRRARAWDRIEQTIAMRDESGTVRRLRPRSARRGRGDAVMWALAVAAAVALLLRFVVLDRLDDHATKPDPRQQAPYSAQPERSHGRATTPHDESTPNPVSRAPAGPSEAMSPSKTPPAARSEADHRSIAGHSKSRPTPHQASEPAKAAASATPTDSGLAREMVLLQRARAALHAGAPADALATLQAHAREFADGQMAEDRDALRVEALCALDRVADAEAAARAFVRAHPGSAHVARVRDACE